MTAGAGGFVDITARARKIVFSGMYNAGAKLGVAEGRLTIEKEGKLRKLVEEVEHVTFSGRRALQQGQDVTYVTERCVMKLTQRGVMVTEIAPGADLRKDIMEQAAFPLLVADDLRTMDPALFVDARPLSLPRIALQLNLLFQIGESSGRFTPFDVEG